MRNNARGTCLCLYHIPYISSYSVVEPFQAWPHAVVVSAGPLMPGLVCVGALTVHLSLAPRALVARAVRPCVRSGTIVDAVRPASVVRRAAGESESALAVNDVSLKVAGV